MKWATQIFKNETAWRAGIHAFKTLKEAKSFTQGVNETGGKARTLKKDKNHQWIEYTN